MAEDLEEDIEDDEEDESGESESRDKSDGRSKIKLIIIAAVALVVLLLLVGGALFFFGVFGGGGDKAEEGDAPAAVSTDNKPKDAAKAPAGPKGLNAAIFMDLPEILVNLQSTGRKQSFLKIRVALELDNPADMPKVDQVMPRIIDAFQVYLRELRPDDLQGSAGMYLLREELLTRVQMIAKPVKINDVLFREMLVQ